MLGRDLGRVIVLGGEAEGILDGIVLDFAGGKEKGERVFEFAQKGLL